MVAHLVSQQVTAFGEVSTFAVCVFGLGICRTMRKILTGMLL